MSPLSNTAAAWTPGRESNPPNRICNPLPYRSATRRDGVGDGNRTRKNQSEGLGASQFACTDEELGRATLSEEWSELRDSNPHRTVWKTGMLPLNTKHAHGEKILREQRWSSQAVRQRPLKSSRAGSIPASTSNCSSVSNRG